MTSSCTATGGEPVWSRKRNPKDKGKADGKDNREETLSYWHTGKRHQSGGEILCGRPGNESQREGGRRKGIEQAIF